MIIITWVTLFNKKKNIYEMSLYNSASSKGKKKEERERERPLKTII